LITLAMKQASERPDENDWVEMQIKAQPFMICVFNSYRV